MINTNVFFPILLIFRYMTSPSMMGSNTLNNAAGVSVVKVVKKKKNKPLSHEAKMALKKKQARERRNKMKELDTRRRQEMGLIRKNAAK